MFSTAEQTRVVTVLGQDLRIRIRPANGDGSGTPLLLCCGIGAGFDVLQPFVDALDPSIEVVRFDVPGVGGSPAGPVPYGFHGNAYLAVRMLRHLGYTRADVLGLSWGGGLAQQMAFQSPRFVRKLVLVSTGTGSVMVPAHPRVLLKMVTPRRFNDRSYAATVVGDLYGGSARTDPDRVLALMGDNLRPASPRGYLHQLMAGMGWVSLPWLPLIRQQTLILAGKDDPIIPLANARVMQHLLPHAELHIHEGGHVALVTEADRLAPVVAAFLSNHQH
ncbi:MAG TPA: poly(3-hydroxyalkanoate) depolymerase [Acidimicrobiales bacterium]|jgi:poly(3-hydroxyalkanoate) depolymerase